MSTSISLKTIEEKLMARIPLTREDGVYLFREEVDLHEIGRLSSQVKTRLTGAEVYYNLNAHLNPTNICRFRCPLCAFSCDADSEKAYFWDQDRILSFAEGAAQSGVSELHWVGGLPENADYEFYRSTLAAIHERFPELSLKAWTAVEILEFARMAEKNVSEVLAELKSVGLSALPGGGAEIFDPELRRVIAPKKPDAQAWLSVHRCAHELGIPTNATMLFGSVESLEHRIDHLLQLRELQDESIREHRPAKFECFVPLVFHPKGTAFADREMIAPHEVLRTIAISRLMLENFLHVKAYWITLGPELAQIALGYGADDFDGTVFQERIHHEAGSTAPSGLSEQRLRELIEETGRIAVRRR